MPQILIRLLGITGLLITSSLSAQTIAVIDAGSSGSRVYMYDIQNSKPTQITTTPKELGSYKIKPGISSLAKSANSELDAYIDKLLIFLRSEKAPSGMKIYWNSTAGMRFVEPALQDKIYRRLKQYIEKHSPYVLAESRTISGREEGALMWLSVNYSHLHDGHTRGILDLGGASTQIAYQQQQHANLKIRLGSVDIPIQSESFLGFGLVEILSKLSNPAICDQKRYAECKLNISTLLAPVKDFAKTVKIPSGTLNFIAFDNFVKVLARKNVTEKSFESRKLDDIAMQVCAKKNVSKTCLKITYFKQLLSAYGFPNDAKIDLGETSWTLGKALLVANQGSLQST